MAEDTLSTTFAALADPTRRAILARLSSGAATVMDVAEPFELSLPAISKHLKVLERAGLIERGREAQWRPCRLQAGPLRDVEEWVERYRVHWEQSFGRLEDYLTTFQRKEVARRAPSRGSPEQDDRSSPSGSNRWHVSKPATGAS